MFFRKERSKLVSEGINIVDSSRKPSGAILFIRIYFKQVGESKNTD